MNSAEHGAQMQNINNVSQFLFSLNLVMKIGKQRLEMDEQNLRRRRILFVARLIKEPKTGSYIQIWLQLAMQQSKEGLLSKRKKKQCMGNHCARFRTEAR